MERKNHHWLRWGSSLLFLMALCLPLLGCGPQAQVQVAVEGPLAEGTQLGGVVRWSGMEERELPAQSATTGTWREGRAYVLTMPAAAQFGEVTVRLRLRDDAGCVVAEGSGTVDVAAQRSYKVTVSLTRGAPCRPELRVDRVGVGFGRVVSEPAGIDCELRLQAGGSCAAGFPRGTKVRLRATVASTGLDASVFAGWRGPCQGAGECELTVDGPLTATARLKPKPLRSRDGWAFEDVPYAVGPPFVLRAVFGFAPDDVWMASDLQDQDGVRQMLHYNGAFWAAVPSGIKGNLITDLHGSASDNVWAVGSNGAVARWDGQRWQPVSLDLKASDMTAVWVSGADDVWLGSGIGVWHLGPGNKLTKELGAAQAVDNSGLFVTGRTHVRVGTSHAHEVQEAEAIVTTIGARKAHLVRQPVVRGRFAFALQLIVVHIGQVDDLTQEFFQDRLGKGARFAGRAVQADDGEGRDRRERAGLHVGEVMDEDDHALAHAGDRRAHRDHVAGQQLALVAGVLLDDGEMKAARAQERGRDADVVVDLPGRLFEELGVGAHIDMAHVVALPRMHGAARGLEEARGGNFGVGFGHRSGGNGRSQATQSTLARASARPRWRVPITCVAFDADLRRAHNVLRRRRCAARRLHRTQQRSIRGGIASMPMQVSALSLALTFVVATALAVSLRMFTSGTGGILLLGFALVVVGVASGRGK